MRNLITRFIIFSLALLVVPNVQLKALSLQNELDELKSKVASALPSGWSVTDAQADKLLFPKVDSLKDRYKGSVIQLVGPASTQEVTPKGSTQKKTVTVSESAELFLIPVWRGISRKQLTADWSIAERELRSSFPMSAQQRPPSEDLGTPYGWDKKHLLVCSGKCDVVNEVAKKLGIPKR